jgi:DMSO reductase family type II enzyme heme b subunit
MRHLHMPREMRCLTIAAMLLGAAMLAPTRNAPAAAQDKAKPATAQDEEGKKILDVELASTKARSPLPLDPLDKAWSTAKELVVKLIPQVVQEPKLIQPTVDSVRVRALNDSGWVAVRLQWSDTTADVTLRSDRFGDAAAVEFPMKESPLPDFRMGNEESPVHLLLWRAERQMARHTGKSFLEQNYPRVIRDSDANHSNGGANGGCTGENTESAAKRAGNPNVPGIAPLIEELNAATWNQLTVQKQQDALGYGLWRDGQWHVVFARPIASSDASDATLSAARPALVAFGVWDGGRQNASSRKMVSEGWVRLKIGR